MNTRIRVLLAIFAITLTSFALATTAQAAPADFTWSTSVSTAQAGGHPNITMNYSSSSTQSLTRLDVDLPQGLLHRNNLTGACSNALYLADNCPSSSILGTVSTQLVVSRITIPVPGTIYQLSAPSGGSDATFGIVLRPPLSSLGLTSKVFVRDQVTFMNGGGLRHSLVGALDSVSVLGVALPSRISQLALTFNGAANNLALTNNPTSCRAQTFTATGTFSDGTSRPKTSSYTTTGCPAVPFAPTAEVQISDTAPNQRTNFAILFGNGGSSASSSLHAGHVVAIGHDFDGAGDFDLQALDAGPLCTEAQAATTPVSCPAGSKFLDLSADIEGFGTVTGAVYKTNSPGHKTVGEITLRQGATVKFPGTIGGDNKSQLTFTGMPQLPFTALRLRSSKPALWITNTCAIRTSRVAIDSFSGPRQTRTTASAQPTCPPAPPTITAGPERGITINTNHVEYRFTSPDSGVTFECKKDDAAYAACSSPFIDSWQGEGAHAFSVRSVRGGGIRSAAATATFSIDTQPPVVAFEDPIDADNDGDGEADAPFRDQDVTFNLAVSDATSGVDVERISVMFNKAGSPPKPGNVREHKQGDVQVGGPALIDPGPTTVEVKVYDYVGTVTIVKLGVIIDGSPPSISIDEPGVTFASGPDVEIPITVADDSLKYDKGEVNLECTRKGWDGTVKGGSRVIADRDSGRSKGFCSFDNVSDGRYKVTVKGWDPVRKEGVAETELVVDRTAPKVVLTDQKDLDSDGDGFADERYRGASTEIPADVLDEESGVKPEDISCQAKVVNKGVVKGNITFNNGNRVNCSVGDLPDGDVEVELRAHNYVGTVTIVKIAFTVDTQPPTVSFSDTGDLDSDGDGFADNRTRPADFSLNISAADDGSGIDPDTTSCALKPRKGGTIKGAININNGSLLRCTFTGAPEGDADVEISVVDRRGFVAVIDQGFTISACPSGCPGYVEPSPLPF